MSILQNTIQKRVWKAVKEKIKEADKHFVEVCKRIDANLEERIKENKKAAEEEKVATADKLVNSIIGKII